jgi:solute carrier family 25 2-oxodicarboxylate transporter 21
MEDSLEMVLLERSAWEEGEDWLHPTPAGQEDAPQPSGEPVHGQLDAHRLFLAGGFAGAIEVAAVQPLDMIKTRFQLSPERSIGVLAGLREVIAEGGVRQLYRGVVPELLCGIPRSSAMFAAFTQTRVLVARARGGRDDWLTAMCAGAVSGVPEALVVTPFQVVKVRMQAKAHMGRYRHSWHCVRRMVETEGLGSLATGLQATILRNCVWNAVYFASYVAMTTHLQARRDRTAAPPPHARATVMSLGFVAGVFATCFNCPFDVVKSRMQAEVFCPPSGTMVDAVCAQPPGGVAARIAQIVRTEGVLALWKGFAAKSMRMGAGGAVGLGAFELACDVLRR